MPVPWHVCPNTICCRVRYSLLAAELDLAERNGALASTQSARSSRKHVLVRQASAREGEGHPSQVWSWGESLRWAPQPRQHICRASTPPRSHSLTRSVTSIASPLCSVVFTYRSSNTSILLQGYAQYKQSIRRNWFQPFTGTRFFIELFSLVPSPRFAVTVVDEFAAGVS